MKIYFFITLLLAIYNFIEIFILSKKLYDQYQYMKVKLYKAQKNKYKLTSSIKIGFCIVYFIIFAYTAYFLYYKVL